MPRPKTFPAEICPPAAPAAVGRLRASPTSATDGLAARECLVRLTVRADTPHSRLLRSFPFRPAPSYGYESAAPAVTGSLLTASAGPHPACSLVSGIVVVTPQPDPGVPQARCSSRRMPRNAYGSPWHTRCLRSSCPPSSLTAKPAVLAMLGGIGAVSLEHTLAALRRPALPSITAQ